MPRELRAHYSQTLWESARRNIIAEWICCEPLTPGHDLCAQGYKAMEMVRALVVDSPEAHRPAPLLDAVMALCATDDEAP